MHNQEKSLFLYYDCYAMLSVLCKYASIQVEKAFEAQQQFQQLQREEVERQQQQEAAERQRREDTERQQREAAERQQREEAERLQQQQQQAPQSVEGQQRSRRCTIL